MLTKDDLVCKYCVEKKTYAVIAQEAKCSVATVSRWMKQYAISPRSNPNLIKINKNNLIKMYVDDNMSCQEISKEIGCSATHIKNKLRKFGIPLRTPSRQGRSNKSTHPSLKIIPNVKVGMLTPLHYVSHKGWYTRCECGRHTFIRSAEFHRNQAKSCGCLKFRSGQNSPHWHGCGEISGHEFAAIRQNKVRHSRTLDFTITIEHLWNLFLQQDRQCAYTKLPLSFNTATSRGTASLDRIDSTVGYVPGNVQWVHKRVNEMKMDDSHEHFIQWCRLVATNA